MEHPSLPHGRLLQLLTSGYSQVHGLAGALDYA
jgi:hypothetical protein